MAKARKNPRQPLRRQRHWIALSGVFGALVGFLTLYLVSTLEAGFPGVFLAGLAAVALACLLPLYLTAPVWLEGQQSSDRIEGTRDRDSTPTAMDGRSNHSGTESASPQGKKEPSSQQTGPTPHTDTNPVTGSQQSTTNAHEILRERYARGELGDEQFENKLECLLETATLETTRESLSRETETE
ncbi:SHOCT domain-containing protein [Natrialbaceae archaeon A-CW2]